MCQLAWPSRADRQLRPGHLVRFGSLNYVADIRGDLIFDGFETTTTAPCHHDEHDINLSLVHVQELVPVAALALDPEKIAPSKDGKFNPSVAIDSAALEPHTDLNSSDICVTGTMDSSPATCFEPCVGEHSNFKKYSYAHARSW